MAVSPFPLSVVVDIISRSAIPQVITAAEYRISISFMLHEVGVHNFDGFPIKHYATIHTNEAISLVLVRALLEYRSRLTSHNHKTLLFQSKFDI